MAEQKKFGRYIVLGKIGTGASGVVYKGKDPLIDRIVAIKTIHYKHLSKGEKYEKFLQRFYREAQASGVLSHPNIITVFDIGEEDEVPYIAMEFVEGAPLSDYIKNFALLEKGKVLPILRDIASALDYAHSQGVIHRDVKPSNVMYNKSGIVKVMDFSIARLDTPDLGTITTSGTMLGTPYYMPPEQILAEKATNESDIYSLGIVAYEMLTGELPFPGTSITSIIYKVLNDKPVFHEKLKKLAKLPNAWRDVFLKVLAKDTRKRYKTAMEFVDALSEYYSISPEKVKKKRNVSDFIEQKTVLFSELPQSNPVKTRTRSRNSSVSNISDVKRVQQKDGISSNIVNKKSSIPQSSSSPLIEKKAKEAPPKIKKKYQKQKQFVNQSSDRKTFIIILLAAIVIVIVLLFLFLSPRIKFNVMNFTNLKSHLVEFKVNQVRIYPMNCSLFNTFKKCSK